MSKREDLLRAGGGNILSSMGAGGARELPPGMDPSTALRRPAHLEGLSKEKAGARIAIDRIVRDEAQPREEFDEEALARLAESLRTRGQLQPIRVRWDEGRGAYVILVGERRWRAARLAGLAELSCIVVDGEMPADERLMIQLVENALREDLRPIEQARAYRALMEARGWSGNQLAKELHIAQSSVVRALSLLDLPEPVQARVEQGSLAATVAHELTKLNDPAVQAELAATIVDQQLTRSEVEEVVKAVRARRPAQGRPDPVAVDLGDGITVVVRYRKPSSVTAVQALRRAMKVLQEQMRGDEAA
jgi:ParB family transcriptional regulator, chromosome partitioning protein